jgi:hypothetical protein
MCARQAGDEEFERRVEAEVERRLRERLEEERWRWHRELTEGVGRHVALRQLQEDADWRQSDRWLTRFAPDLQQIAERHGVGAHYVRDIAHKLARGKVPQGRKAVARDVDALLARHPLWGPWSPYRRPTFVPGEPRATTMRVALRPDEEASLVRLRPTDRRWAPERESLSVTRIEHRGGAEAVAETEVKVGDVVRARILTEAQRAENARREQAWETGDGGRRWREWEALPEAERAAVPIPDWPELLPGRSVAFVVAPDGALVRLRETSEADDAVRAYAFRRDISLDALLDHADRDDG